MSIFDRKKPLKTIKKYMERFFTKKDSERIDFVDTTLPVQVEVTDVGEPGAGGWNDSDSGQVNPDNPTDAQWLIEDADGDTIVNTEQSADEDKIRFDTAGSERFRMEANDTDGGALYIKEGAGTVAPSTPSSGEGVVYEKNDGKLYFKNDGGTEYDLTSGAGGGMTSFDITGDSGSAQTITDGNTVDIEGGTGINTVAGATDKVTINCDLEGTELKSTGETGGTKFLREDGDGTCSWQTVTGGSGGTVQGTDHTYDIQATDDGSPDGNARGESSIDLQTARTNATEVASGTQSVLIGGSNNTASNGAATIAGGTNNTASGQQTFIGSGNSNTASGFRSAVIAGNGSSADGTNAIVIGGTSNTATANFSTVVGGKNAETKRTGTTAIGGGDGSTFTDGEAQCGQAVWSGRTTNNSATELFLTNDGSSRFTLDSDSAVTLEIWASVVDEAAPSTYNAGFKFVGTVVNDSGTTAIGGAGSITKTSNPSAAFAFGGGDMSVTADNTNDSIKVEVTGLTGRNIRWVVSMRYTEVVV